MGKNGYTLRHALLSTYLLKLWLVPPKRPGAENNKRSGKKKTATRYERTQGRGEAARQNRNCTSDLSENVFSPKRLFSSWGLGSPGRGESASRKFAISSPPIPNFCAEPGAGAGACSARRKVVCEVGPTRATEAGNYGGGAERAARLSFRAVGHASGRDPAALRCVHQDARRRAKKDARKAALPKGAEN